MTGVQTCALPILSIELIKSSGSKPTTLNLPFLFILSIWANEITCFLLIDMYEVKQNSKEIIKREKLSLFIYFPLNCLVFTADTTLLANIEVSDAISFV